MIDYYSYKKIYTSGDMFTLSGEDFVGLAQYKDGIVTDAASGSTLITKPTHNTDLFTSQMFKDRTINDLDILLPVEKSECLFGLNEALNYKTLKFKLDNIRTNNTFVYSRAFIASNNLPFADTITYAGLSAVYDSRFSVYSIDKAINAQTNETVSFSDSDEYKIVSDVFDVSSQVNYDNSDSFALFCVTPSSFISITANDSGFSIIENSSLYDSTTANNLEFGEIGGITSNNTNAFISDKANNTVIKYDITGYLNNDTALRNRRYLQGVIGGEGNTDRRTNFREPTVLACNDEYLAVYDSGNKCIKLFTTFLEYVTTLTIFNLREERLGIETFNMMEFDPDFKSLYVITTDEDGGSILYRLDVETREVERVVMVENIGSDRVRSIAFSQVDSNYWQFCTGSTVYKKYKTTPEVSVGHYTQENLFNPKTSSSWDLQDTKFKSSNFKWNLNSSLVGTSEDEFKGIGVTSSSNGQDRVVVVAKSKIYYFNEPTSTAYQKVINKFNYTNYGVNGFSLSPDEYIQPAVINSEIYKVVYDLLVLKNNIVGRFSSKYEGGDAVLQKYNYNIDLKKLSEDNIANYFIHHNEENILGAINRVFDEIYTIQDRLIRLTEVDTGDVLQSGSNYIKSEDPSCANLVSTPPNIGISKSVVSGTGVYTEGDIITYKVSIVNNGGTLAESVSLTDSLDNINITSDPLNIFSGGVNITPGQTYEVIYNYTVTASDGSAGKLINTATVTSPQGGDKFTTVEVPVVSSNNSLLVNKSVTSLGPYSVGSVISYSVNIINNGNSTADNIRLLDSLDPINIVSDPLDLLNGEATLLPGEETTITYNYVAVVSDGDTIVNTATVESSIGTFNSQGVAVDISSCASGMDIAFLFDFTSSMSSIFEGIVGDVNSLVSSINSQSSGNYRLSLMTVNGGSSSNPSSVFSASGESGDLLNSEKDAIYLSLPLEQRLLEDTNYDLYSSNRYFTFTAWEMFGGVNNDISFKAQLNLLYPGMTWGPGSYLIEGDSAIQRVIDNNFLGEFRSNIARYIVFITDEIVGTAGVTRADNIERLAAIKQSALDKNIKILVLGPGVDYAVPPAGIPNPRNPGAPTTVSVVVDGVDYTGTYPWRDLAEGTGGVWNSSSDATAIEAALTESCTIS